MTELKKRLVKISLLRSTYRSKIEERDSLLKVCCQPS